MPVPSNRMTIRGGKAWKISKLLGNVQTASNKSGPNINNAIPITKNAMKPQFLLLTKRLRKEHYIH